MAFYSHVGLDQPASYLIKVEGRLADSNADWFQGPYSQETYVSTDGVPVTSLVGVLPDQAALHGLLRHVRDLGLALLYVDCLSARDEAESKMK